MNADRTIALRELTREIIGAYYAVYNELPYGYLESVYRRAMAHELRKRGLAASAEVKLDVWYDGVCVGRFRADLIVENQVLVECKAIRRLTKPDYKQILNYLCATDVELGLLFNFGPSVEFRRLVWSNVRKKRGRVGLEGPPRQPE